jgi:hypothetical protein
MDEPRYWQPGPSGATGGPGVEFLGVTGAATGPAFFGVTGATGPTAGTVQSQKTHRQYLYDRARVELAGVSDGMIRLVMFDVFHEFFNDSSLWLEAIPGQVMPGVKYYYLVPGQPQSMGDNVPEGRIIGLAGIVQANHFGISADMPEPPVMRLQFAQSNEVSVWATVIKSVKIPHNNELPDVPYWVVNTYEPYILAGIKGMLQLQTDKPYSDQKMGQLNYQRFRQGVNIGRVRAMCRNSWGGQAWAYPQQFRTASQRGWGVAIGNNRMF